MANLMHRATGRRAESIARIVGMDQVTATGAFAWTVPPRIDLLDIIAVGGGSYSNSTWEATSGGIAVRIGKPVAGGQLITGVIGRDGATVGGTYIGEDTTVDGMVASGGRNGTGNLKRPTGGEVNIDGVPAVSWTDISYIRSLIQTQHSPLRVSSSVEEPVMQYLNGSLYAHTAGRGGYSSNGSMPGAVTFIMYKLETL